MKSKSLISFAIMLLSTVTASPTPLQPGEAELIQTRQTSSTFMGTCTVSTNLCLVASADSPSGPRNFTCGRFIAIAVNVLLPSKFCTVDGHACKVIESPLTTQITDCSCSADNSC
ncbi:hypothetical protein QBC37DRAFT_398704 [Rhypophila decipiens]|uniref:Uncharacterized protein n=1 Tax=Rhypophila decipiens TaxID=261697 RepID=A0AAN6YCN4_9PEZI|nr:hypothetical protein QBC37DRAFT_398704 [Rhypophila decipiens]